MLRELDRPLIYGGGGQVEIQYRWMGASGPPVLQITIAPFHHWAIPAGTSPQCTGHPLGEKKKGQAVGLEIVLDT